MKAITIGGATNDFIAIIEDEFIERMTMHNATSSYLLFEEGHKVEADSIDAFVGGGATNAAVSMARLGFDVSSIVKIGNDHAGRNVLRVYENEGVNAHHVITTEKAATGRSIMVSSHVKNPTIFVARGANTRLRSHEIVAAQFEGMDLVYITGLSGDSSAAFPHIVSLAKQSGAKVAANPGIRQLSSRSQDFYSSLQSIDILSLNAEETSKLVPLIMKDAQKGKLEKIHPLVNVNDDPEDVPDLIANGLTSGGFEMSLGDFFATIIHLGIETFVLTNGKEGAYIGTKEGVYFCRAKKVEVLGTAGAGDAFFSTFVSLFVDGASIPDAVHAATINSASVVGEIDTQSGLLKRSAVKKRLKEFDASDCVSYKFI